MKKLCIILILSISITSLFGCKAIQTNQPISKSPENQKAEIQGSEQKELINVTRAEGKSDFGNIKIISKGKETVEQLGADSSLGKAADYSFAADYDVIYEPKTGAKTVLAVMNNLRVIQPENASAKLNKLTFEGSDIFYFIPEYSGSNDVSIRFFAVTNNQKAFQFKIENNKAQDLPDKSILSESTAILSTTAKGYVPPKIVDKNKITFLAVYNTDEGQSLKLFKVIFSIDIKNRVLKYVSKEEVIS